MRASLLAQISHNRWAIPVLSELHHGNGAKLVTLVRKLELGRESVIRALKSLIDAGWVRRNPGHGHPMRPEYVLTKAGQDIGPACKALHQMLIEQGLLRAARKKWWLPILLSMSDGAERFSAFQQDLPAATPRALAATLKQLVADGVVMREVIDGYPPRPRYSVSVDFAQLIPVIVRLGEAVERCCSHNEAS